MNTKPAIATMVLLGVAAFGAAWRVWQTSDGVLEMPPPILECNIGDVPPGFTIERTVSIPNPGSRNLTIKSVIKDCSCLSHELSQNLIPPGESAKLSFKYVSPSLQGPFAHRLDVSYLNLKQTTTVSVQGTVGAWFKSDITELTFQEACIGSYSEREVVVRVKEPWPESERMAELRVPYARIVDSTSSPDNLSIRYRIGFSPGEDAEMKRHEGEFLLSWAGRDDRGIRIPCIATVVPFWSATPRSAFFGILSAGRSKTIEIDVFPRLKELRTKASTAVVRHELGPAITAHVTPLTEGALKVSIKADPTLRTGNDFIAGEVHLLDTEERAMLSIPVNVLFQ